MRNYSPCKIKEMFQAHKKKMRSHCTIIIIKSANIITDPMFFTGILESSCISKHSSKLLILNLKSKMAYNTDTNKRDWQWPIQLLKILSKPSQQVPVGFICRFDSLFIFHIVPHSPPMRNLWKDLYKPVDLDIEQTEIYIYFLSWMNEYVDNREV